MSLNLADNLQFGQPFDGPFEIHLEMQVSPNMWPHLSETGLCSVSEFQASKQMLHKDDSSTEQVESF